MKNITISLQDDLYRRARVAAAEADTSVTALVREFLTVFTHSESEKTPRQDVLDVIEKIRSRHPNFNTSSLLTREELHSRS